jgi:hypothetical protein
VTVDENPSCSITPPSTQPDCGTDGNTLTASASGGTGPYTFSWSIDNNGFGNGWCFGTGGPGPTCFQTGTGNPITYHAGATGKAIFTVTVTDASGTKCTSTCTLEVGCSPPQTEFCGLTQGFYGNQGGKFNNLTAAQIMHILLCSPTGTDLVVGKPGHSFTVKCGDEACIIKKLPANSTPTTLPPGDGVFGSGCSTTDNIPTGSGNRWLNVLLGQTITLSFNVRYDTLLNGGPGLGGLTICSTMVTQGSLVGPDGIPGSGDEVIDPGPDGILGNFDDPKLVVSIPNSVMCALVNLGLPTTVNGLLELANRALGADANLGGASIADINFAVNSINVGFDRCRFLISCTGGCVVASSFSQNSDQVVAQARFPVEFVPFASSMNLFRSDSARSLFSRWAVLMVNVETNPAYFGFGL